MPAEATHIKANLASSIELLRTLLSIDWVTEDIKAKWEEYCLEKLSKKGGLHGCED